MYAFLRGIVARKGLDQIELDVNGVGYQVYVPEPVSRKLAIETTATLLTHCHIREDAFTIFGFLREEDRALFRMLLGITGIGPKVAMAVLSAVSVQQAMTAVRENDVKPFLRASGVGKKVAQRIVLEMKAKLGQDAELNAILGEPEGDALAEDDDVMAALMSLGCTLPEAKKAATSARQQLGSDARDEDLVAAALRTLSRI